MTPYVALLRAVNVGGTGKLPMTTLVNLCEAAGLQDARTYIASANVVFRSDLGEAEVCAALEDRLRRHADKSLGVPVRTAAEVAGVLARNLFPEAPGNRVIALFVDGPLPADALDGVTGGKDERVVLGERELFIHYPNGMASSRIRLPSEKNGTARNMNTVAKLADMAMTLESGS